MPHTHRKKPAHHNHKRLQVTDDSGWTHVSTSGKTARQVLRTTAAHQQDDPTQPGSFVPAEAPARLTAEDLRRQFEGYRSRWESSDVCRVVSETLQARRTPDARAYDGIVCVGLGSPSGFLRGGWVDRRSVSMYQLAGLVGVVDWLKQTNPNVPIYAQDPVFNELDKSLLSSLDITVLEHPHAFEKVTPATFLYCPGAEQAHLSQLLALNPKSLFGGPLEDVDSEVVRQFVEKRGSVRLPRFQEQEHAFWNMRIYCPEDSGEEDE
ncbi:SRR1 family protein [Aspergillus melleus]|uniref:SRR1 family protein n=1 Tax=Aspergillus melleus TaxID=138277 RepID=UPI001E8E210C|nr:uncharacterized protein LDX57_001257 [Aspergillus melleus]KAH8423497.1 hypothetical protein LDX57_001257 [Aspergillus melleus]